MASRDLVTDVNDLLDRVESDPLPYDHDEISPLEIWLNNAQQQLRGMAATHPVPGTSMTPDAIEASARIARYLDRVWRFREDRYHVPLAAAKALAARIVEDSGGLVQASPHRPGDMRGEVLVTINHSYRYAPTVVGSWAEWQTLRPLVQGSRPERDCAEIYLAAVQRERESPKLYRGDSHRASRRLTARGYGHMIEAVNATLPPR